MKMVVDRHEFNDINLSSAYCLWQKPKEADKNINYEMCISPAVKRIVYLMNKNFEKMLHDLDGDYDLDIKFVVSGKRRPDRKLCESCGKNKDF